MITLPHAFRARIAPAQSRWLWFQLGIIGLCVVYGVFLGASLIAWAIVGFTISMLATLGLSRWLDAHRGETNLVLAFAIDGVIYALVLALGLGVLWLLDPPIRHGLIQPAVLWISGVTGLPYDPK